MTAPTPPDPARLRRFPVRTLRSGGTCYRVFTPYDPAGTPRSHWYFSSAGNVRSGRFDLPAPDGTCYLSDRKLGAVLEVVRGAALVCRTDLERRRLAILSRTGPDLQLASLVSARAAGFGVTLDVAAGDDYLPTQAWAAALASARHPGLLAWIRHDPAATARSIALFGPGGARRRVAGWRTSFGALLRNPEVVAGLAHYGIGVVNVPYDVEVARPD